MMWQSDLAQKYAISDTTEEELDAIPYPSEMLEGAFCPQCGSDDVHPVSAVTYVCEACHFDGPQYQFFVLTEEDYQ
ncbi:MAG: hypothetical protein ACYS7Y_35935 [Planctomycetota bacterium]